MAGREIPQHIQEGFQSIQKLPDSAVLSPVELRTLNKKLFTTAKAITEQTWDQTYSQVVMPPEEGLSSEDYEASVALKGDVDQLIRRFSLDTIRAVMTLSQKTKGIDLLGALGIRLTIIDAPSSKDMQTKKTVGGEYLGIEVFDLENPEGEPAALVTCIGNAPLGLNLNKGLQQVLRTTLTSLHKHTPDAIVQTSSLEDLSTEMKYQLIMAAGTSNSETNPELAVAQHAWDAWMKDFSTEAVEEEVVSQESSFEQYGEQEIHPEEPEEVASQLAITQQEETESVVGQKLREAAEQSKTLETPLLTQITRASEYPTISSENWDRLLEMVAQKKYSRQQAEGAEKLIEVFGLDEHIGLTVRTVVVRKGRERFTQVKEAKEVAVTDIPEHAVTVVASNDKTQTQQFVINGKFLKISDTSKLALLDEEGKPLPNAELIFNALASATKVPVSEIKWLLRQIEKARTGKEIAAPKPQEPATRRDQQPIPPVQQPEAPAPIEIEKPTKRFTVQIGSFQQGSPEAELQKRFHQSLQLAPKQAENIALSFTESPDFSESSVSIVDPEIIKQILSGTMTREKLEKEVIPQITKQLVSLANRVDTEAQTIAHAIELQLQNAKTAYDASTKLFVPAFVQHILAPHVMDYVKAYTENNPDIEVNEDIVGYFRPLPYPMTAVQGWIMRYNYPEFVLELANIMEGDTSDTAQTFIKLAKKEDPALLEKLRTEGKVTLGSGETITREEADALLVTHKFYDDDFVSRTILAQLLETIYPYNAKFQRVGEQQVQWSAMLKPITSELFSSQEVVDLLCGKNIFRPQDMFDIVAHRQQLLQLNGELAVVRDLLIASPNNRDLENQQRELLRKREQLKSQSAQHIVAKLIKGAVDQRIHEIVPSSPNPSHFDDPTGDGSHARAYLRAKSMYEKGHLANEPHPSFYKGGKDALAYEDASGFYDFYQSSVAIKEKLKGLIYPNQDVFLDDLQKQAEAAIQEAQKQNENRRRPF